MAEVRPTGASPATLPARPLPVARAEAIKAAQRAFFDQATAAAAQGAPPPRPATTVQAAASVAAAAPAASPVRVEIDPTAPAPRAPLRPGSLLDIKV